MNQLVKNLVFLSCFIFVCGFNVIADNIDNLIKEVLQSDWEKVLNAKNEIENYQQKALPALFELLEKDSTVKLKNTGDLIYPGAEKVYGHGQIIEYDIDKIPIRAGWIIEQISFQNFGFSIIHEREEILIKLIKENFREFLTEKYIKKLENSSTDEIRHEMTKLAIKKAKTWWKSESDKWTRLQGIIDALHSSDTKRQLLALQYLRNGSSKCEGLTIETYIDLIKERISQLSKSNIKRVSEQAKFILNDTDFEFIRSKS